MSLADSLRAAFAVADGEPAFLDRDDVEFDGAYADAAVLIPITDRAEPGVLLTLRQSHLRRHAGQIAFPGGRTDPEDSGPIATALREAHEEIGLDPTLVDIVDQTAPYHTGTGYLITPVIGVVPPDLPLVPHEAEVAAVFEVPLAFLLEPQNQVLKSGEFRGRTRQYHEIMWQDRRIWGATAAIIVNLSRRLAPVT